MLDVTGLAPSADPRDGGGDTSGFSAVPDREPLPEGMYIGLQDTVYHGDPSLGSHDVMNLLKTPMDYWANSWMNPIPDEREANDALDWGSAAHKLVLEGWDAFRAAGGLVTLADLKKFCADHGVAGKGLKDKADWIKLVRSLAASNLAPPPIYDLVVNAIEASGRVVLSERMYREVIIASKMIACNPHIQHAFTEGFPEVSFFWREDVDLPDGRIVRVPCKGRVDWLKIVRTVDFKTIAANNTMPFETAVDRQIWGYRYDVQCAHYQRGRERGRHLAKAGKVFFGARGHLHGLDAFEPNATGEPSLAERAERSRFEKFLPRFIQRADFIYSWVFLQKGRAPVAEGVDIEAWPAASARRERALRVYAEQWDRHGTAMWVYDKPVRLLSEADAPPWVGESEAL
jgi:PDDEXK-like domain of unknown function (DUF3799)